MTGSLTPQSAGASDDLGNASYQVTGTGTANDAHRVPGVTLIDPTTGLPYAASGGSGGGGGGAVTLVDGADVTQGASTDTAASPTIMGRILKFAAQFPTTLGQKLSAASLGVVIASDQSAVPVSGTVTANAGSGTQATSNSNLDVALSTRLKSADTLTAVTTVGAVTAITNALPAGSNSIGAVTNTNLDVALSTRLKPADTLAGVTTVAAVTAITNALPAGTNAIGVVGQKSQTSLTATLATNVTGNSSTTGQSLDGYDGAATIELVAAGTGTQAVSLQIEGSLDNTNWYIVGTAQIDATANPAYSAANFTLTLAGGVTVRHLYALRDTVKYVRITTTANTLATGLSSTLYTNPV